MNFRTTYILFGVLAALLIVVVIALYTGPAPDDENKFIFPSLNDPKAKSDTGEVDRITLVRSKPEEKLVFERDSRTKRWKVNEFYADRNAINNLVQHIYAAEKVPAESPKNLADWGLESPGTVITLRRGEKKSELKLSVGNVSQGEESAVIYVLSSDRPKEPLAVAKAQLDIVLKDVTTFRDRNLIVDNPTDLQAVGLAVGKDAGAAPTVSLVKKGSLWRYTAPKRFEGGAAEMDGVPTTEERKPPSNIRALLTDLASIKVEGEKGQDFVANNVEESNLGKLYNLGAADEKLIISFRRTEENGTDTNNVLLVGIGPKDDDKTEKLFASFKGDKGETHVVLIPKKSVAALLQLVKKPDALRDKHLVRLEGSKSLDAIVLRNAYTTETKDGKPIVKNLEFFKTAEPSLPPMHPGMPTPPAPQGVWKMYRGDDVAAVEVNLDKVKILADLLTGPVVVSFPDETATEKDLGIPEESKAEVVVEVWSDGLQPADKKAPDPKAKPKLKDRAKPTAKLIFGGVRADQTVAVKRIADGEEPALLLVKKAVLDQVSAKPVSYRGTTLPTFADRSSRDQFKNVTRLELMTHEQKSDMTTREKDFVLVREEEWFGRPTWKIEKPEELKGRKADEAAVFNVLMTLGALQATSLEEERATEDALEASYGLGKSAVIKAVVTVVKKVKDKEKEKDETKTHEFRFGKNKGETEQFGKQGENELIFVVEKSTLAALQKELLDSTIFTFDAAAVKSVKLEGLKKKIPGGVAWELERKNGAWSVKGKEGLTVNADNLDKFLRDLATLKATRFVANNRKEIDPSYELDLAKGALSVAVTVEGRDKPFLLTIGKLDGTNGHFAISPQVPGDIFQLDQAAIKKSMEDPLFFVQ